MEAKYTPSRPDYSLLMVAKPFTQNTQENVEKHHLSASLNSNEFASSADSRKQSHLRAAKHYALRNVRSGESFIAEHDDHIPCFSP